jgi:hypothetical protein
MMNNGMLLNALLMLFYLKDQSFSLFLDMETLGKHFLWNTIITYLRTHKKIVLSVASSRVASLLLPGGRTTHSRFRIPCDDLDETTCNIKRGTMLCQFIQASSLIIWDEVLMTNKISFEALDRTLHDIVTIPSSEKNYLLVGK